MKTLAKFTIGLAATLVLSSVSFASAINGSDGLSGLDVSCVGGTDLSNCTSLTTTPGDITNQVGKGDYSTVPTLSTFTDNGLNLSSLSSFVLTGTAFTFTAIADPADVILDRSSNFLDVYILGNVTGLNGSTCGTPCDSTLSSLRFSFNQSGNSISEAITLNSPPNPPTPEPATMALFGSALVGLGLMRRRRKA